MTGKTKSQTKLYAELLSLALKAQASKSFDTRKAFSDETVWVLIEGHRKDEFHSELAKIRKKLGIPRLNQKDDWVTISSPTGDSEMDESSWLYGRADRFISKFETAVTIVLQKYKLPNNFREWVELQLLYRKTPKTFPIHYFDLAFDLIAAPEWVNTTALTTKEKKFAKKLIAEILGFKKRPPEKLAEQYKRIRELLDQSKNRQRRMRTIKTAIEAVKKPRNITYHDFNVGTEGEDVIERYTFERLAEEVLEKQRETGSEEIEKAILKKKAARLRKQKQRLLQRHK